MVERTITDPNVLETIRAELMQTVFQTQRRTRLQVLACLPHPCPINALEH